MSVDVAARPARGRGRAAREGVRVEVGAGAQPGVRAGQREDLAVHDRVHLGERVDAAGAVQLPLGGDAHGARDHELVDRAELERRAGRGVAVARQQPEERDQDPLGGVDAVELAGDQRVAGGGDGDGREHGQLTIAKARFRPAAKLRSLIAWA